MEPSDAVIPKEFYRAFVAYMPVLCVDLLIKDRGAHLLVMRLNDPLKGIWWVPGGRILKGESAIDAAKRKAAIEVGLDVSPKFVGIYEGKFESSAHGVPTHTVSLVYEAEYDGGDINLDRQSGAWKWGALPKRFSDSFSKA